MPQAHRSVGRRQLVVLTTFLSLMAFEAPAIAQWTPGEYMTQALGRMMGSVLTSQKELNIGYDDGISIMAAYLEPRGAVSFVRSIEKGQLYMIAGGGDDDVTDLDIEVLDANGKLIKADTKDDNYPVVTFTANYTGRCTIRETLYSAKRGSFCVVAVLRRGGWQVPRENVLEAAGGIIAAANRIDRMVASKVYFQSGPNQWALYGGLFGNGKDMEVTNIGLGTGRRIITAAGDTQTRDIDLFLRVGNRESKDDDPDATPILDVNVTQVQNATLKIKNAESAGTTLILTTILVIE